MKKPFKQPSSAPAPARPTLEEIRMQLWSNVAAAVARAEDCKSPTRPGQWADEALAAFDKRFGVK